MNNKSDSLASSFKKSLDHLCLIDAKLFGRDGNSKRRRRMDSSKSWNVNFFKPSTPFLKENIRAIIIGLIIWAVAVYGFQILLKILEKPTPEEGYAVYEKIYPKLKQGVATLEEKRSIAKVYLSLVGKAIPLQHNGDLKNVFTATVYDILPEDQKEKLIETAAQIENDRKIELGFVVDALDIKDETALKGALPYALSPISPGATDLVNPEIQKIMDKYLVHNQSVLTDTIFLGFPFHYFYTALFLLTLFVLICLIYCYVIDGIMKKYDMESTFE